MYRRYSKQCLILRPRGYKTFFMLSSIFQFLSTFFMLKQFFLLINVKMPTIYEQENSLLSIIKNVIWSEKTLMHKAEDI